ncbi:phosphotransferase enzyme family protein [Niveomyces insectorum RCEF 264]|uniref:Phosphotransferase enzyme family protein n=1 Tax=Niveomyces insectorum RCEF 264 TaxID=1081102 RepID=A0A167W6G9_9HYPO|nr:phosphotransferase enzyme family protein [Niveomyces insectorum RCEF 264]
MRDYIAQDRSKKACAEFIQAIQPEEILQLASSYHDNEPCKIFRPPAHGSFNVCFFVAFEKDHWVVRLPIPSSVFWVDEKLEAEVATMKYVTANTTIPVPKVHAFAYARDSPIQKAFIIMDYVEGKNLTELGFPRKDIDRWCSYSIVKTTPSRKAMYRGLAHVYSQLCELKFSTIGALGFSPEDGSIVVRNRPLTVEVALQEREGLEPTAILPEKTTFRTASEYIRSLLRLGDNLLNKGKPNVSELHTPFAFDRIRAYVTQRFCQPDADTGPFVLFHGDFNIQNLLWDDDVNLVAVLDWEWSSVVPLQLVMPPTWLNGDSVDGLMSFQLSYFDELAKLNAILRDEFHGRLTWPRLTEVCDPLIVCALMRPERVYNIFWFYLSYIEAGLYPKTAETYDKMPAIESEWIEAYRTDEREAFMARRKKEVQAYFDAENAYFDAQESSENADAGTNDDTDTNAGSSGSASESRSRSPALSQDVNHDGHT